MRNQFPHLYSLTDGTFSEPKLRGLEFDMEFQTNEVKRELRAYREFQRELATWYRNKSTVDELV